MVRDHLRYVDISYTVMPNNVCVNLWVLSLDNRGCLIGSGRTNLLHPIENVLLASWLQYNECPKQVTVILN